MRSKAKGVRHCLRSIANQPSESERWKEMVRFQWIKFDLQDNTRGYNIMLLKFPLSRNPICTQGIWIKLLSLIDPQIKVDHWNWPSICQRQRVRGWDWISWLLTFINLSPNERFVTCRHNSGQFDDIIIIINFYQFLLLRAFSTSLHNIRTEKRLLLFRSALALFFNYLCWLVVSFVH